MGPDDAILLGSGYEIICPDCPAEASVEIPLRVWP